jgi:hypothetical protein
VLASDADDDTMTYSLDATSIGLGMSIGSSTGIFSWSSTTGLDGNSYNVTVTVGDGTTTTDALFTINVGTVGVGNTILQADIPKTISSGGNYVLGEDVTATAGAIVIATDSVVDIDFGWNTITFGTGNGSGVHCITGDTARDNVTLRRGYIVHGGNGDQCVGVVPRGANWELDQMAITGNSPRFRCVGNDELSNPTIEGSVIKRSFMQALGSGTSGRTDDAPRCIYLESRGSESNVSIYQNILIEAHYPLAFKFWGYSGYPTITSTIYQNQISSNRINNAKGPYCVSFNRSSNFNMYHNRITSLNGRGVICDGFGQTAVYPWATNNNVHHNAIGCNFQTSTKIGTGTYETRNVYGVRDRYHSGYNNFDNNSIIVTNQVAVGLNADLFIGSDAADPDMTGITANNNKLVTILGATSNDYSNFRWDAITDVTYNDNEYLTNGAFEDFGDNWIPSPDGRTGSGNIAYAPSNVGPVAPSNLTLRRFFDTYILEWDESAEEAVWAYKVYKNGVAVDLDVLSARSQNVDTPKPFWYDIGETGTATYTVSAVTVYGVEGAQSSSIATTSAATGWE